MYGLWSRIEGVVAMTCWICALRGRPDCGDGWLVMLVTGAVPALLLWGMAALALYWWFA